jgi:hypothetical protein
MNTINYNLYRRPNEVAREPQTVNSGYKHEFIVKTASRIIGAALWTGAWVVGLGYIIGWLRF